MKYFLDTEFLEGTQRTWWGGKTKPTIDLISIAILGEDGREYFAVSKEFNLREAWNRYQIEQVSGDMRNRYPEGVRKYWIRDNVLLSLYTELLSRENNYTKTNHRELVYPFTYKSLKNLIRWHGKTNAEIAIEIQEFVYGIAIKGYPKKGTDDIIKNSPERHPVFYGYFADYDWVVFCWLFGKMIDLPKGFPYYCRDLKQMLDEKVERLHWYYGRDVWSNTGREDLAASDRPATFDEKLKNVKGSAWYPVNKNEHDPRSDARWNRDLYDFITHVDFETIKGR